LQRAVFFKQRRGKGLQPRFGRMKFSFHGLLVALAAAAAGNAATANVDVYRCAGSPAIYTSDPRLVREGRCEKLGASQAGSLGRRGPPKAEAAPTPRVAGTLPSASATVARGEQQQRDRDRHRILETELTNERQRHAQLVQKLRAAEAADTSEAARATQIDELEQAIRRSETDIASLGRELALVSR
jgi:hypothetical protein